MFWTAVLDFFCIPFIVFISFLIILSAVNKSVGVRRAYVKLLLKIFEVSYELFRYLLVLTIRIDQGTI